MIRSIRQCGSTIAVRVAAREELGPEHAGCADEGAREIVVPADASHDAALETVLHEALEIWCDRLALDVPHHVLGAVGVWAFDLIRGNPELCRRIGEG